MIKKKQLLKNIFQVTFFSTLATIAIFYILFNSGDPKQIFINISQIKFFPFLLTLIVVFICTFLDGFCVSLLSKQFEKKFTINKGFLNAIISNYIAVFNKTAAMIIQTSTLNKQGIKASRSVSIITMNFLIYQFSLVLYSIFSFFISYNVIKDIQIDVIPGLKVSVLSLIGLSINTGVFILIILFAFNKTLHRFILTTFIDILDKLHLIKNADEKRNKWAIKIITYHVVCSRIFKEIKITLICIATHLIKFVILNSIPFLTFWVLGANNNLNVNLNFLDCFYGSNFLSLILVYIPTGAPEIAFKDIFTYLLGGTTEASLLATSGTLVWRLETFFIPFIVGGLFYLLYKGDKKERASQNTMKIYDLQLSNILEESKSNKNVFNFVSDFEKNINFDRMNIILLDKEQVIESFSELSKQIEERREKEEEYELINKHQNQTLLNVIKETDEIINKNNEISILIKKEAEKEIYTRKRKKKEHTNNDNI